MRRSTTAACAALLLLLSATAQARAQGVRTGLWVEGAIGTGTVRNTCAGCPGAKVGYGSTFHARAGGALNPRVLLGVEYFSMYSSQIVLGPGAAPVDAANRSIAPIVIWYVGQSGFFLKGGAGLARGTFTVESTAGAPVTIKRTGSGLTFGVGLDIRVMRWLALSADLGTYVTAIGDVMVDDTLVDDIIATVYEAAIGITIR